MSNEFKHASVGAELSQAEWEAAAAHVADGQTAGDVLYYDGAGWKRRPYNIGARVYNNANISVPDNTLTLLTYNSERWDTDTIHDNSTNPGRLTCKTAGVYLINVSVEFASNSAGVRLLRLRVNGSTTIGEIYLPATAGAVRFFVSTIYSLAVDDYVESLVYQDSTVSLNVLVSGNRSPEFMMQRIG